MTKIAKLFDCLFFLSKLAIVNTIQVALYLYLLK